MFVPRVSALLGVAAMFGNLVNAYEPHADAVYVRHEPITVHEVQTVTVTSCEPPHPSDASPGVPEVPEAPEVEYPIPPMSTVTSYEEASTEPEPLPSTRSVVSSTIEVNVPTTSVDEVSSAHTTAPTPTSPDENMGPKFSVPAVAMGPLIAMVLLGA